MQLTDRLMNKLIDDYRRELRHMRANAPYVPSLCLAVVITGIIGLIISA